jgi:hypothetical protein
MSSGAALMSMLWPMLEIGARVLFAIASGLLAVVALRISSRGICQGQAGVFLMGWALRIVGVCGASIGFASLAPYRSSPMLQGVPEPISGVGFWSVVRPCKAPIALAVGSGVLIALWLRRGRGVGAAAGSSRDREARSRRIGAVGKARVAAELKRIGLPALHNVIIRGAGWSVELDHVVRAPSGIVVLETKTFGGTIEGQLDSPVWTQRTAGGVELCRVDNPLLQNEAHVSALEGFLGDLRVPICGYVVSAGRARFASEIVDAVVSVRDLQWVLSIVVAEPSPRVLDAAWRWLEGEAAKSPGRRAAHEDYARRRRDAFRVRRQG